MHFTWDPTKARQNAVKHGVSFEEAESVFYDEHALELEDPDGAQGEDRFLLLGLSGGLRLLAVCHCIREAGEQTRIISARRAVRAEQTQYWERLRR